MRLSPGYQILIAAAAGIFAGLFFGPFCVVFKPIASIYIMLLQMVVLPYICLSIIFGLGSLVPRAAIELFKSGWFFWALLWAIMFFVIFLLNLPIPKVLSGSLLQTTVVPIKEVLGKNLLDYLVPANPVSDFANNIVPAIAVFGVIVGIALMFIEKKEPLLSVIDRGNLIIEKILGWLALIAPIAIFAHLAVGMGTFDFTEMHKLGFYIASFIAVSLFITFWILPLILSAFTPLSFRESLGAIRTVCLVAFVTGVPTIAIPYINVYLKKIGQREEFKDLPVYQSAAKTLVPISYSFAQIGNALILFFILFASYYFRNPLTSGEKSLLSILTIPLSIGSSPASVSAVSFLFKELNFPEQAIGLFTAMMPITMNFQVLLSVAGVLTFILLVLFAKARFKWKTLTAHVFGSLVLFAIAVWAIAPHIHLHDSYKNLHLTLTLKEAIDHPVIAKIYQPGNEVPLPADVPGEGVLERILRTGTLRVGYDTLSNIPYVYHNQDHELVGLDIAAAYQLAQDLGCRLELIPLNFDRLEEELNTNRYDIAMSAILMTEKRIKEMSFSDAYSEQNFDLIIPIEKKATFANLAAAQTQPGLVIGAVGGYKRAFFNNFPNAKINEGYWESELLEGHVDAWVSCHIISIVWCLNHPEFTIQEYGGLLGKCYFAYPVRQDALTFLRFMNNWIQLKRLDGFYVEQYNYWILGNPPKKLGPSRWSIIRNVLHWVK